MKTKIKIGEKSYNIEVLEIKDGLLKVGVDDNNYFFAKDKSGELLPVDKEDYKAFLSEEAEVCEIMAEKEIKSPIAGTVSRIFVKEGDNVRPGQKVATLIAMKMENEIIAEGCGVVEKIKIKEGQFINTGEVLMRLK